MTSPRRFSALLGAFLMLTFVACGEDGVPGDAVVKIGSDSIKTSVYDHWFRIVATTAQQQTGATGKVAIPKPPDFTACVAKKKTAVKGQPKPIDATYKTQCEQEYTQLREKTMQFLISSAWIEGEAAERGVKISDAQVKKDFDKQRQRSFPKDKDYFAFLKRSGNAPKDLLYSVRIQSLSEKLRKKVLEGTDKVADKVTEAQIVNYYNKNKIRFAIPERRDLRMLLTETEAQAKKAKAALDGGQSFASVVRKYSIDQATKADGGERTDLPKGQLEKALDAPTFKAPKNKITGPVKTQFGYYLFEVTKITPGKQEPLTATRKASIKQLLIGQKQQPTLDAFVKDLQKKWKDRTECRKGYQTVDCSNAPKTATTTQPTTTVQK